MNAGEVISVLERILNPLSLSNVQDLVFRQSWEGLTYPEIAERFGYSVDYIKDVGSKLWRLLSEKLGERVSKCNFRPVIRRVVQRNIEALFNNS